MISSHSVAHPLLYQARSRFAGRFRSLSSLAVGAAAGAALGAAAEDCGALTALCAAEGGEAAGIATVVLSGDLDLTALPYLALELAQVLAGAPRQLIVDMTGVGFLDCAAARLIVGSGQFLPEGGRPVLYGPGTAVRRLLRLTGLDAQCHIEPGRIEPGQIEPGQIEPG